MNKELLKLKKILTSIIKPTREELICKALQTIFNDEEVGLTDKDAFDVLGWNYNSKEELFTIHNKNNIKVTPYKKYASIIFNTDTEKEIEGIDGAIVFNLGLAQEEL